MKVVCHWTLVIAKRGQKKVRYRLSGKKDQNTIVAYVNAIGQALPPMVPGTFYGMSDKGWTNQELFQLWLKNHFLKYAVPIVLCYYC